MEAGKTAAKRGSAAKIITIKRKKMDAAIIGLGLIGGSMALELRHTHRYKRIIGVEANADHARLALELGLADEVLPLAEALRNSSLVVLAVPVNVIAQIVSQVLDLAGTHAVVIDTGSTKAAICKAAATHSRRGRFVAAHPIAGTENYGPRAAFRGLFQNKINIVCESEKTDDDALQTAVEIFGQLGMRTVFMPPDEHDRHLAYVSHLSHVSSFLLGQTVLDIEQNEKHIAMLAGSGFASTVRLAKSSPAMWAPIFEQNREYLSQALQEYIIHLQRFQYHLMKGNTAELFNIMRQANEIRRVLNGISETATSKTLTP
ncbi:MAG: prephenate dehydrogenase [Cyclobacteriaceae bacterium]|nr:MAG: prephenate dehydrogenase [Cyclobacteriaceae bacterium]